ncbi:tetratricopeptide repeat protein [Rufibacter latericius]|uniref:Uncharacterized protein n=1 Tax=Rufibacter latericius TaxID=2487040 RepID=A0A3M9MUY6_9BACT|nr:tetratricopeptide repeat protein [Rufibacter latericius]RNI29005.1 hypothetical protein EFB08_06115 [Rufibacter latericius]
MRYWWLLLLLASSPLESLQRIALRNQYTQEAETSYKKQEYLRAAALYEKVRQYEDGKPHASVLLNLAHSYFHLHEYTRASPLYRLLLKTNDRDLLSTVATQLAVIEAEEGNYTHAVNFSKQALKADENNLAARYNFELLQKYLMLHPEKRQNQRMPPKQNQTSQKGPGGSQQPNASGGSTVGASSSLPAPGTNNTPAGGPEKDQGSPAQRNQMENFGKDPGLNQGLSDDGTKESNSSGGNKGSNQQGKEEDALLQTRYERLQKMQLSPEKARQLLDAMRQEEAQYLQQVPRTKTKQTNKNTPDW